MLPDDVVNVQIVDAPALPPGCDFLTGDPIGPFVDTGLDVMDLAQSGRVYLSFATISDLAQRLGMSPPLATAAMRDRNTELEAALTEAMAQNQALVTANEALFAAGYQPPPPAELVPPGSVQVVMAWVYEDPDPDVVLARARLALAAEVAEEHPRKGLQKQLTDLIDKELADADAHPE